MDFGRIFPETWKFGSHERAQRRTPIVLVGSCTNAAGAADYTTLRKSGTTAGYQVTAGTTLVLTRLRVRTAAATVAWTLAYGDNDVGLDSAAAATNPVMLASELPTLSAIYYQTTGDLANHEYDVYYEIPAGKYVQLLAIDTGQRVFVELTGHEV